MHAWSISTPPPVGVDSIDKFRSGQFATAAKDMGAAMQQAQQRFGEVVVDSEKYAVARTKSRGERWCQYCKFVADISATLKESQTTCLSVILSKYFENTKQLYAYLGL